MRAYYAYLIHERKKRITQYLKQHKGGRLYQQFLVDAYATVEENRFDCIREKQKNLRSEAYDRIQEAVLRGETDPQQIGDRFYIPTSHTGARRYMINNYQNDMAICRHLGNPDLFITFTCNAKWPEIVEELHKRCPHKSRISHVLQHEFSMLNFMT